MPYGSMAKSHLGYVETDPTGRYGRLKDILGKGAVKTVYKAFDQYLGMEVAWNQVLLNDAHSSPDDLQRLFSEVRLLKNMNHECIMKYITSWIDTSRHTFNFITEMFTSGSLREYRLKHKHVSIRAVKAWSRQILRGLVYLHSRDPPVIHRDLKCDNIFINGHLGQVKIGDLGFAAILNGAKHHSVIGTPEFMAPELYDEDYDELVDIYAFGMSVLEMLTSEFPYGECSNSIQIYRKVSAGLLPDAFERISDEDARKFVGKCLEKVEKRPAARDLLQDPFLAEEEGSGATDMTITGTMNPEEDDTIHLKVQICDDEGQTRNVHFPFDINKDTAMDVAIEMVKDLEITDLEAAEIARMIDDEIHNLLPNWRDHGGASASSSNHADSDAYLVDDASPRNSVPSFKNMTLNNYFAHHNGT